MARGPGGRPKEKSAAARLSWGLADQAVSSLTNFAVGIVVARSLGTLEFGVFSLAWVTYGVILNISRGLGTDPMVVRFSTVDEPRWRSGVSAASGTTLVVGLAAGLVSLVAGLAIGGDLGGAFAGLGIVLPVLMLQDSWRYAFFAAGQGDKSFLNDLVWGLSLVPALFVAAQFGTVFAFVLAWGAAAGVAAAVGCLQFGGLPDVPGVRQWFRDHRDLGVRYLTENLGLSGALQLKMYGLGVITGFAAVGAIRGADLMLGPFMAVLMGLSLVSVPEAARVLKRAPHRLSRFCFLLGIGLAAGAALWGIALILLLPHEWGVLLLGPVWDAAAPLLLPTTLAIIGTSASTGSAAGLRALGAAGRSVRAQLTVSAIYVCGALIGAFADGALGAAWGTAAGSVLGVGIWYWQLRGGLRDADANGQAEQSAEAVTGPDAGHDLGTEIDIVTRPIRVVGVDGGQRQNEHLRNEWFDPGPWPEHTDFDPTSPTRPLRIVPRVEQ